MDHKIPVFIICRDLLTWPAAMVPHILRMGGEPVFVDNASTYPPLLEFYSKTPHEVVRLEENLLQHSPWTSGAVDHRIPEMPDGYYVVTDPDLDISGCPDDTLVHLKNLYDRYSDIIKCGLSLEILDLPEASPVYREAKGWETPFWLNKRDWQCYRSPVDTTFAIYNKRRAAQFNTGLFTNAAIRADRPFTARHLPFYWTQDNFDLESWFYLKHANPRSTMARYLQPLVSHFEQHNHRKVERFQRKNP